MAIAGEESKSTMDVKLPSEYKYKIDNSATGSLSDFDGEESDLELNIMSSLDSRLRVGDRADNENGANDKGEFGDANDDGDVLNDDYDDDSSVPEWLAAAIDTVEKTMDEAFEEFVQEEASFTSSVGNGDDDDEEEYHDDENDAEFDLEGDLKYVDADRRDERTGPLALAVPLSSTVSGSDGGSSPSPLFNGEVSTSRDFRNRDTSTAMTSILADISLAAPAALAGASSEVSVSLLNRAESSSPGVNGKTAEAALSLPAAASPSTCAQMEYEEASSNGTGELCTSSAVCCASEMVKAAKAVVVGTRVSSSLRFEGGVFAGDDDADGEPTTPAYDEATNPAERYTSYTAAKQKAFSPYDAPTTMEKVMITAADGKGLSPRSLGPDNLNGDIMAEQCDEENETEVVGSGKSKDDDEVRGAIHQAFDGEEGVMEKVREGSTELQSKLCEEKFELPPVKDESEERTKSNGYFATELCRLHDNPVNNFEGWSETDGKDEKSYERDKDGEIHQKEHLIAKVEERLVVTGEMASEAVPNDSVELNSESVRICAQPEPNSISQTSTISNAEVDTSSIDDKAFLPPAESPGTILQPGAAGVCAGGGRKLINGSLADVAVAISEPPNRSPELDDEMFFPNSKPSSVEPSRRSVVVTAGVRGRKAKGFVKAKMSSGRSTSTNDAAAAARRRSRGACTQSKSERNKNGGSASSAAARELGAIPSERERQKASKAFPPSFARSTKTNLTAKDAAIGARGVNPRIAGKARTSEGRGVGAKVRTTSKEQVRAAQVSVPSNITVRTRSSRGSTAPATQTQKITIANASTSHTAPTTNSRKSSTGTTSSKSSKSMPDTSCSRDRKVISESVTTRPRKSSIGARAAVRGKEATATSSKPGARLLSTGPGSDGGGGSLSEKVGNPTVFPAEKRVPENNRKKVQQERPKGTRKLAQPKLREQRRSKSLMASTARRAVGVAEKNIHRAAPKGIVRRERVRCVTESEIVTMTLAAETKRDAVGESTKKGDSGGTTINGEAAGTLTVATGGPKVLIDLRGTSDAIINLKDPSSVVEEDRHKSVKSVSTPELTSDASIGSSSRASIKGGVLVKDRNDAEKVIDLPLRVSTISSKIDSPASSASRRKNALASQSTIKVDSATSKKAEKQGQGSGPTEKGYSAAKKVKDNRLSNSIQKHRDRMARTSYPIKRGRGAEGGAAVSTQKQEKREAEVSVVMGSNPPPKPKAPVTTTAPHAPKLSTQERHGEKMYSSFGPHNESSFENFVGRLAVVATPSSILHTTPRLTIPKAPRLSTSERHGEKIYSAAKSRHTHDDGSLVSGLTGSPTGGRGTVPRPRCTRPIPFNLSYSNRKVAPVNTSFSSCGGVEDGTVLTLAESIEQYNRCGLRKNLDPGAPLSPMKSGPLKPTIPQTPEVLKRSRTPKRCQAKSRLELEEEMMAEIAAHPFKARPCPFSTPENYVKHKLSESSRRPPTSEEVELAECAKQFRAYPMPDLSYHPPSSTKAKRATTTPSPFNLSRRNPHLPSPSTDEIELTKKFKARSMPDLSRSVLVQSNKENGSNSTRKAEAPKLRSSGRSEKRISLHKTARNNVIARMKEKKRVAAEKRKSLVESLASQIKQPNMELTKPEPFRLRATERGEKYRQELDERVRLERKEMDMLALGTKAKPPPKSIQRPNFTPQRSDRQLTQPVGFHLESDVRHGQHEALLRAKLAAEEKARLGASAIKANPVPDTLYRSDFKPLIPSELGRIPLTGHRPNLQTEQQSKARKEFDEKVKEAKEKEEMEKKRLEEMEEMRIEEDIKKLRRRSTNDGGLIPTAKPIGASVLRRRFSSSTARSSWTGSPPRTLKNIR